LDLAAGQCHVQPAGHGVEILFCLAGPALLSGGNLPQPLELAAGESVLVPDATAGYEVRGPATLYRASVP
jgi:mannose-6-phosphate isomerase class I